MGILTSAVNNLVTGVLSLGFGQLDKYITRKIEEGQYEEAFRAADQWENGAVQKMTAANQGGGVLPTGPIDLVPSNESMAQIQKSPLAAEMVRTRQQQFVQNDPYFIQQAAQRKQQESLADLNKQMGFETFKQNQGGTGVARDIFGGGDITQDVRNQANAARNKMLTTATEEAKEPFRDTAMQREMMKKQSPSYAQLRGGGAGGGAVNTINPATLNTIDKRISSRYPQYRTETMDPNTGKIVNTLNERGQRVSEIIADKLATTKKPNAQRIESEAVAQEMREFKGQGQQDMGSFQNFAGQIKQSAKKQSSFPGKYPSVTNKDGSVSNVKLGQFEIDGRNYVIPTMVGGKQLTGKEAVDIAIQNGLENYPSFASEKEANDYAKRIHSQVDENGNIKSGITQQPSTQMTDEQKIQILRQRGVPEEEIQKALQNK